MKIQTLKEEVAELKKQLCIEIEKGKDEADKTHNSFSTSFKTRIKHIEKTLYSGDTGDLSARVLAIEGWLENAEAESDEAVDSSRFSKTFFLALLAFLVPTAIAVASLIITLFTVSKNVP